MIPLLWICYSGAEYATEKEHIFKYMFYFFKYQMLNTDIILINW